MGSGSLEQSAHWDLAVRRAVSRVFLLSALADRPMHGYELAQEIAVRSGECCAPSDAAIYPALRELQEGGYITCEVESQGRRERKVCSLTDAGREVLAVAAESWGRVMPHLQVVIDEAPRRGASVGSSVGASVGASASAGVGDGDGGGCC